MFKVAYLCEPHVGGLFSFFEEMRPAFLDVGIDLRCVSPYPRSNHDGNNLYGDAVEYFDGPQNDEIAFLRRLERHLLYSSYSALLCIPGNSPASNVLSCVMPTNIRTLALVPHNGRGVYLPTARIADYLDWIIPVNDLLLNDLVGRYRIPREKVRKIYIGVHTRRLSEENNHSMKGPLQIAYTSRLEDLQKNIMILPDILKAVCQLGGNYTMMILCGGPDQEQLIRKFARLGLSSRVEFHEHLSREEMLKKLSGADVFLMTSRFEGCPHALIEAMSMGCVPVVPKLHGIFDTMVSHGDEGYLCELDQPVVYATCLQALYANPEKLRQMGLAARERARRDFDVSKAVQSYKTILFSDGILGRNKPLKIEEAFKKYSGSRKSFRNCIPAFVKKRIRNMMAKSGISI